MKRFLSAVLVIVMLLTALTSCAVTTTSLPETTLSTDSDDIIQITTPNEEITSSKEIEETTALTRDETFIDLSGVDVSKLEEYKINVEQASSYLFKVSSDRLYGDPGTSEKFEDPIKSVIKLGKYETEADLTEIKTYKNSAKRSFYILGDIESIIYESEAYNTWSFFTKTTGKTPLAEFGYSEITVETLEKQAQDYLLNFIDLDLLKNFKYEVFTYASIVYNYSGAHTSSYLTGFLSVGDEIPPPFETYNHRIEKIQGYRINYYIELDSGFRTADYITIDYNANGDIFSVCYRYDDIDKKSITFDRTSVDYCVQQWIEEYIRDDFELIGWTYKYSVPEFHFEDETILAEVIVYVKKETGNPFYDNILAYISK